MNILKVILIFILIMPQIKSMDTGKSNPFFKIISEKVDRTVLASILIIKEKFSTLLKDKIDIEQQINNIMTLKDDEKKPALRNLLFNLVKELDHEHAGHLLFSIFIEAESKILYEEDTDINMVLVGLRATSIT